MKRFRSLLSTLFQSKTIKSINKGEVSCLSICYNFSLLRMKLLSEDNISLVLYDNEIKKNTHYFSSAEAGFVGFAELNVSKYKKKDKRNLMTLCISEAG